MTNPNLPPSDEDAHRLYVEFIIAEDWEGRCTANAAHMRYLDAEIDATDNLDKLIGLGKKRNEALVKTLGSGVLTIFKRGVIAEREGLETEFGDR